MFQDGSMKTISPAKQIPDTAYAVAKLARPSPAKKICADTAKPANRQAPATLRFDHARVWRTDLELTQQCYFPSLPP